MSKYKREGGVGKKNRGKEGLRERDVKEERGGRGGLLKKKEKGGEVRGGKEGGVIKYLSYVLYFFTADIYQTSTFIFNSREEGGGKLTYTSKEGGAVDMLLRREGGS